jgi:ferredoxin-type protein NapG
MDDDRPMDRRRFFREGLRGLLRPLAAAVQPLENMAHQIGKLDPVIAPPAAPVVARKASLPIQQHWLRPPGALDEKEFADKCSRCGECVRACPVQCIQIDSTGEYGNGLPYIDTSTMSCVMCDELACMARCPSGALLPTPRDQIDMGTALVRESMCLRTAGQECTICIDHCPVGEAALGLVDGRVRVIEDGCTGCGRCEHECPTMPKSIIVEPKSKHVSSHSASG